jgi:hypothetical protein
METKQFAKKLWISFGIIVVSIAIAGGALYFFSGDLSANADAIVAARAALNQQTTAVENLASLKQQAVTAAQYQAAINQLVPNPYGLVAFPQWFGQQGLRSAVTANASLQGEPTPSAGTTPGYSSFSFTVTGSLAGISSFMDFVSTKSSGYLVAFNSFNITTQGSSYSATGLGTVFSQ